MKRFLVFAFDSTPCGGWNDFVGGFATKEEAEAFVKMLDQYDVKQIVDTQDGHCEEN